MHSLQIITENLAFLSLPSRSFSRFARIGIATSVTDPRNAGREDLRCPFGCREHHRRQRSTQRSIAYYQTEAGKQKKKRLNARRPGTTHPPQCEAAADPFHPAADPVEPATDPVEPVASPAAPTEPLSHKPLRDERSVKVELRLGGVVLTESSVADSPMLPYVRLMANLIDGIVLTRRQLVRRLVEALRQHSMAYRTQLDNVLHVLHHHPPWEPSDE